MNCEEIQSKLSLLVDNQLNDAERREVEKHLESCPVCREYYQNLLKLEAMADDLEMGGDESYWISQKDSILEKIAEAESEKISPIPARRSRDVYYRIGAVAAAVVLVASISIFESMETEPTKGIFSRKPAALQKIEEKTGPEADDIHIDSMAASFEQMTREDESNEILDIQLAKIETDMIESKFNDISDKLEGEESFSKIGIPVPVSVDKPAAEDADKGPADKKELRKKDKVLKDADSYISVVPIVVVVEELEELSEVTGGRGRIDETADEAPSIEPEPKPREIIDQPTPGSVAAKVSDKTSSKKLKPQAQSSGKGGPAQASAPMPISEPEPVYEPEPVSLIEQKRAMSNAVHLAPAAEEGIFERDNLYVDSINRVSKQQYNAFLSNDDITVDVDESVLGVSRVSLDPATFGHLSEERQKRYLNLRDKVAKYNYQYSYLFSSHGDEIMAKRRAELKADSLRAIVKMIAITYHDFGKITPLENERDRMVQRLEKLKDTHGIGVEDDLKALISDLEED